MIKTLPLNPIYFNAFSRIPNHASNAVARLLKSVSVLAGRWRDLICLIDEQQSAIAEVDRS